MAKKEPNITLIMCFFDFSVTSKNIYIKEFNIISNMFNIDKALRESLKSKTVSKKNLFGHVNIKTRMPDLSSNSFLKSNNNKLFDMNKFKLKPFGGKKDFDFDGVPNWKDCLPRNTMRQHRYSKVTKKKDFTVYQNPEGKKVYYWKKDPEEKGRYPSMDDVAYILDELPAVYHGPKTHVNVISRKQFGELESSKGGGAGSVSEYTLGTFKAWGRGKDKPIINIYPQHRERYKGKHYPVTREALVHEIGHDIEKRKPELQKVWKEEVYPQDSPTKYGMHAGGFTKYRRGMDRPSPPEFYGEWDEDFAESFTTWHPGVIGTIHTQQQPLTQQRKTLFKEHIPERRGPSAREAWEQKQRPGLLIKEAAKKATEDKDKDGIIAAADRNDNDPNNPRGFHWRETPDRSVPRWWARFKKKQHKKEEEILPVTHKEPPWAKIRRLKNKKEEEEIRYQIELNRINRMFPVAGGVKNSELTSDGFKLNKVTRKSLRDKDKDGFIAAADRDDNNPENPRGAHLGEEGYAEKIIDYVYGGLKPLGHFSIPSGSTQKTFSVENYIRLKGLHFKKIDKVDDRGRWYVDYYVSKTQPVNVIDFKDNTYKPGIQFGYPQKAIKGYKRRNAEQEGLYDIQYKYRQAGYPVSDFEYLDFVPYGMTPQEINAEVERRKQLTNITPELLDVHTRGFFEAKDKNPKLTYEDWAIMTDPEYAVQKAQKRTKRKKPKVQKTTESPYVGGRGHLRWARKWYHRK